MKKTTLALLLCAFSLVFACSKGGFQTDARAMYNDIITVTEKTAVDLDKSSSAKEAGSALEFYADQMKKFSEKGKELEKKYGKKDIKSDPELNPEAERMKKAMESFGMALSKVMIKWQGSPEITAAMTKLMSIGGEKAE